jgi:catechol 2,3-dioxygenase-like lactoylglutathione lyase family enzyme
MTGAQSETAGGTIVKVEWMNHTSFVVRDMDTALAFYRDTLGFVEERNTVIEGERISTLTGFPNCRLHAVLLGIGDMKHAIELLQYISPVGVESEPPQLNSRGAAHLGFVVDDLEECHQALSAAGIRFVTPPAISHGPKNRVTSRIRRETGWSLSSAIPRRPAPKCVSLCEGAARTFTR